MNRRTTCRTFMGACLLLSLTACQGVRRPADSTTSPWANLPAAELRNVLAELANAHAQKRQLVALLSMPFMGVDEPFKDFFSKMSTLQRELQDQLHAWADEHHVDLTYHRGTDTLAHAVKIMEDRQAKVLTVFNQTNRERSALIQMYTDYEYRVSLLQALLPAVRDPALKAYVEKSLKIHENGSAQLTELLKRFKPTSSQPQVNP
jgi:hypothetical protein